MAVNGDQTALAAIADPVRVDWLLRVIRLLGPA
jgi:hypothetical protein